MLYSLWGKVQDKRQYEKGIYFVTTASHGGFMISYAKAKKILSEEAFALGEFYNGYLCYEEDNNYNIVLLEIETLQKFFNTTKEEIIKALSAYYPEYLLSKGIQPTEKEYTEYKSWNEFQKRYDDKDPDLIISALNYDKNTVKVTTADKKEYLVSAESYNKLTGWNRNLSDTIRS